MTEELTAVLKRVTTGDQGTKGFLHVSRGESQITLCVMELPWRNNAKSISCIPAGTYKCFPYASDKIRKGYEITNVQGRSGIVIHSGNWAGDKKKGWKSDSSGCRLVGLSFGHLDNQEAVLYSKKALGMLFKFTEGANLNLTIENPSKMTEN